MRRPGWRAAIDVLTSLVLIAAASTLIYRNVFTNRTPPVPVPSEPLAIGGAPIRGSASAQAVMIVYSDFQCPYCGRFAREVLPEIERRYIRTGRVALVFRHLPLPNHPHAVRAAWNAECAGQQGKFWEMHDAIFAEEALDERSLLALPDAITLDREKFEECLGDEAVRDKVQTSAKEANVLGVRSTPTVFFGVPIREGTVQVSVAIAGALPAPEFAKRLDAILGSTRTGWLSWLPFIA
jgi:protein-disulfide isomerase